MWPKSQKKVEGGKGLMSQTTTKPRHMAEKGGAQPGNIPAHSLSATHAQLQSGTAILDYGWLPRSEYLTVFREKPITSTVNWNFLIF